MKRLYKSSVSLLLLALSISAYPSLSKGLVLQTTELIDSDSFLEGAEFELTKQKNSCLLTGVGYEETGQN